MDTRLKNTKKALYGLIFGFAALAILMTMAVVTNDLEELGFLIVLEIFVLPFLIYQWVSYRKMKKEGRQEKGDIELG